MVKTNKKKKQEESLKRRKIRRQKRLQIDSDNLRSIIQQKLLWAQKEKEKGFKIIAENQKIITQLDGIILFIKDLIEPED